MSDAGGVEMISRVIFVVAASSGLRHDILAGNVYECFYPPYCDRTCTSTHVSYHIVLEAAAYLVPLLRRDRHDAALLAD